MATDGAAAPAGVATDEADAASGAAINNMEALMNAMIALFIFDPLFKRKTTKPPQGALPAPTFFSPEGSPGAAAASGSGSAMVEREFHRWHTDRNCRIRTAAVKFRDNALTAAWRHAANRPGLPAQRSEPNRAEGASPRVVTTYPMSADYLFGRASQLVEPDAA
ncbi:hypothetical protein GCM10009825_33040 [Arthrobacter humicola]|uniref:Uncharacterized protein n=1 Tax=Arthrobacter humicola TaxID=409291 RepID=A0ABP5L7V7_9MICC